MPVPMTAEGPRTTAQLALARIRDGIMSGRYAPGEKLWQERLARELNVSRIPIREALSTLAGEGLVTLLPNRGAAVPLLSEDELDELYALGTTLERMAARRAVRRLGARELESMRATLARMQSLRDDPEAWYVLNQRFHAILIEACGWPRLIELVHGVRRSLGRYLCITRRPAFDANAADWDLDHAALYQACRDRDEAAVGRIVQSHWQRTRRVLRETLKASGTPSE